MSLDYQAVLTQSPRGSISEIVSYLSEELPYLWRDAYLAQTTRVTNIIRFTHGSFEYIFDDHDTLEAAGIVPRHPTAESRLVAVLGIFIPHPKARDDRRLRRWVGPTETLFGPRWDKGHFIAHSIGGAVDGVEANVFIQCRDLNRGWSVAGKLFRAMERHCVRNAGTFCFSRPLYSDETARPASLDFGILRGAEDLWVEHFINARLP